MVLLPYLKYKSILLALTLRDSNKQLCSMKVFVHRFDTLTYTTVVCIDQNVLLSFVKVEHLDAFEAPFKINQTILTSTKLGMATLIGLLCQINGGFSRAIVEYSFTIFHIIFR